MKKSTSLVGIGFAAVLVLGAIASNDAVAREKFNFECRETDANDGTFECKIDKWFPKNSKAPNTFAMDMKETFITGAGPVPDDKKLITTDPPGQLKPMSCPGWFLIKGKWVYFSGPPCP